MNRQQIRSWLIRGAVGLVCLITVVYWWDRGVQLPDDPDPSDAPPAVRPAAQAVKPAKPAKPPVPQNPARALAVAAGNGLVDDARKLLDAGADVNLDDGHGTPLIYAATRCQVEMVKLLASRGADLNKPAGFLKAPPLIHPIVHVSVPPDYRNRVVRALLELGADPNRKDEQGWTPLMRACEWGYAEIAADLLKHGAKTDAADAYGGTALWKAIQKGSADVVGLLLKNGADPNVSRDKRTALAVAIGEKKVGVVQALLDGNAKVTHAEMEAAVYADLPDVVRLLNKKGGNINGRGPGGRTLLTLSASLDKPEMVKFLLQNDADVNGADDAGWTALQFARAGKRRECAKVIEDFLRAAGKPVPPEPPEQPVNKRPPPPPGE